MGKGLSPLQRFILKQAYKNQSILNSDVLIKRYGFKQISFGSIKFNRHQIGMRKYLSASASVARSLTRLRARGLMTRDPFLKHRLTKEGIKAVKNHDLSLVHNG